MTAVASTKTFDLNLGRAPLPQDLSVDVFALYDEPASSPCPGETMQVCTTYRNHGDTPIPFAEVHLQLPGPGAAFTAGSTTSARLPAPASCPR